MSKKDEFDMIEKEDYVEYDGIDRVFEMAKKTWKPLILACVATVAVFAYNEMQSKETMSQDMKVKTQETSKFSPKANFNPVKAAQDFVH